MAISRDVRGSSEETASLHLYLIVEATSSGSFFGRLNVRNPTFQAGRQGAHTDDVLEGLFPLFLLVEVHDAVRD